MNLLHKYHFYDSARQPDGDVGSGQTITIYETEFGATLATLYDENDAPITNPITVPTDGFVDLYAESPKLWLYSTGDSKRRPLYASASPEGQLNVKDFGAQGDGVTDDTQAFLDVLAIQKAQCEATIDILPGWHRFLVEPIYMPPGQYKVKTGELKIDYRGAVIKGAGKHASQIVTDDAYDDGIMFEIGGVPFTTDPNGEYPVSSYWCGSDAQSTEFHDFAIIRLATDNWYDSRTLNRQGVGIQDNGAGNVTTWNILIRGFEYGFACPYGHDFGYHYNLEIMICDVGLYLALGTEQCQFFGLNVGLCNENIVFESCMNIMIYGVNTSTPIKNTNVSYDAHDITFINHLNDTNPSRMGVTLAGWSACRSISIYNLWEERAYDRSDDGGLFRAATAISSYIHFSGDNPAQQIQFYDPLISAKKWDGETLVGEHCWMSWENNTGQQGCTINIYNPWLAQHTLFDYWFGFDFAYLGFCSVRLENPMVAGVDVDHLLWWEGYGTGTQCPVGMEIYPRQHPDAVGTTCIRHGYGSRMNMLNHNQYGIQLSAVGGSALDLAYVHVGTPQLTPAFRFLPNEGLFCFGDSTSTRKHGIKYASAAPVSGTWVLADIVFNDMSATTVYVGWVCIVAGTPGTWVPFGALVP